MLTPCPPNTHTQKTWKAQAPTKPDMHQLRDMVPPRRRSDPLNRPQTWGRHQTASNPRSGARPLLTDHRGGGGGVIGALATSGPTPPPLPVGLPQLREVANTPCETCDIPSGCCFFTGPWTVTRSSLRMLHRVAAFCRPLRSVLLLVSFPHSESPVVAVLGLCWMWHTVPFARQWQPVVGILGPVVDHTRPTHMRKFPT